MDAMPITRWARAVRIITDDLPALAMAILPFVITFAVMRRYVFGQPVRALNEFVVLVTIWVVFFGLAAATRTDQHPAFDILPLPKNPIAQRWIGHLRDTIMLVICMTLLYFGFRFAMRTGLTFITMNQLGKKWGWLALPSGMVFTIGVLATRIWRRQRQGDAEEASKREDRP